MLTEIDNMQKQMHLQATDLCLHDISPKVLQPTCLCHSTLAF